MALIKSCLASGSAAQTLTFENASSPTTKDYDYLFIIAGSGSGGTSSGTCSGGTLEFSRSGSRDNSTCFGAIYKDVPSGSTWSGSYASTAIGGYYS